jgi:hypothetical protein
MNSCTYSNVYKVYDTMISGNIVVFELGDNLTVKACELELKKGYTDRHEPP